MNMSAPWDRSHETTHSPIPLGEANQDCRRVSEPVAQRRGDRFALTLGVICFAFLATLLLVDIMKGLLVR